MEEAMNACTPTSVFQLFAAALTFLLAVLWLEMHWVRITEDLHSGNIARALRKRGWLNALVALAGHGPDEGMHSWLACKLS
jgi:hypothetical protein